MNKRKGKTIIKTGNKEMKKITKEMNERKRKKRKRFNKREEGTEINL